MNYNGKQLTESQRLTLLADDETAEDPGVVEQRALDAMARELEASGIRRVEALLDGEAHRRVLTMTPEAWGQLSDVEQRNLMAWTERRLKLLSEKLCLMRRNSAPDLELPEAWRASGAA